MKNKAAQALAKLSHKSPKWKNAVKKNGGFAALGKKGGDFMAKKRPDVWKKNLFRWRGLKYKGK